MWALVSSNTLLVAAKRAVVRLILALASNSALTRDLKLPSLRIFVVS